MGIFPSARSEELKRLQLQLEDANRMLDQIEHRSLDRRLATMDRPSEPDFENPEMLFAACVASGMSKIQTAGKSGK
jgi:hypothetical protein